MLSEEEKKAIEKLKKIKEDTMTANECGLSNNDFKEEIEVKRALNVVEKEKKQWIEENKEKDKQIDLMAKWISERCLYIDEYGNSCEIIQDSCSKRDNCKDCIKQYFEKQAKEKEN